MTDYFNFNTAGSKAPLSKQKNKFSRHTKELNNVKIVIKIPVQCLWCSIVEFFIQTQGCMTGKRRQKKSWVLKKLTFNNVT